MKLEDFASAKKGPVCYACSLFQARPDLREEIDAARAKDVPTPYPTISRWLLAHHRFTLSAVNLAQHYRNHGRSI